MKSNKKRLTAILSVILVAAIAIGATLAYLSTITDEKENVFTFAQNIKAKLDEPNWDPDEGENLTPGYEVKKDPMITNKSDNGISEYVAIKLTFENGAGTTLTDAETARLLSCLTITWNSNWGLKDGTATSAEQVYIYKNVLAPGQVSEPVFSSVTIKSDISDADFAWLAGMVLTHTDGCYTFGTHNATKCNITYAHHTNCEIFGEAAAGTTAQGGTTNSKTCDCVPALNHISIDPDDLCPTLIGTPVGGCGHTADASAISGFNIIVAGAAVQAGVEGMTAWDTTATVANLVALFA